MEMLLEDREYYGFLFRRYFGFYISFPLSVQLVLVQPLCFPRPSVQLPGSHVSVPSVKRIFGRCSLKLYSSLNYGSRIAFWCCILSKYHPHKWKPSKNIGVDYLVFSPKAIHCSTLVITSAVATLIQNALLWGRARCDLIESICKY
jgi:hypothetical protein